MKKTKKSDLNDCITSFEDSDAYNRALAVHAEACIGFEF
jgi:hypothetical protein